MGQRYSKRLNITVEYDLKKNPLSSTEKYKLSDILSYWAFWLPLVVCFYISDFYVVQKLGAIVHILNACIEYSLKKYSP